ncbi:hypothetical protein NKH77_01150 [Streptomyces sp. M19]
MTHRTTAAAASRPDGRSTPARTAGPRRRPPTARTGPRPPTAKTRPPSPGPRRPRTTRPAGSDAPRSRGTATGRRGRVLRSVLPVAAFLVVLVGGWQIVAVRGDNVLIPDVPTVWSSLTDTVTQPLFYDSLGATLLRVGLGFALAFVTAVVVGIAMGRVEFVRRFFEPAVLIGLTVPGLVWALLCVIWFGCR